MSHNHFSTLVNSVIGFNIHPAELCLTKIYTEGYYNEVVALKAKDLAELKISAPGRPLKKKQN